PGVLVPVLQEPIPLWSKLSTLRPVLEVQPAVLDVQRSVVVAAENPGGPASDPVGRLVVDGGFDDDAVLVRPHPVAARLKPYPHAVELLAVQQAGELLVDRVRVAIGL